LQRLSPVLFDVTSDSHKKMSGSSTMYAVWIPRVQLHRCNIDAEYALFFLDDLATGTARDVSAIVVASQHSARLTPDRSRDLGRTVALSAALRARIHCGGPRPWPLQALNPQFRSEACCRYRSELASSFAWYSRIAAGSLAITRCSSCVSSYIAEYIARRQTNQDEPASSPPTTAPHVAAVGRLRDVMYRRHPYPAPPADPSASDCLRHGAR
jgi:hypothetical protein